MLANSMISIIIPCYNNKNTLERAINSALNHKNVQTELILVDDASTDPIAPIIEKINDPRINFIQLKKNGGPAHARNIGIEASKGMWIQFLDADDVISNSKLSDQLSCAGHSDIVVSDWIEKDISRNKEVFRKNRLRNGKANIFDFLEDNPILIHVPIIKASLVKKVGGFNPEIFHEDWEFWIRVASMKPLIKYVPGFYATYMRHDKSRSYNKVSNYQNRIKCLQQISNCSYIKTQKLQEKINKSIRNMQICLATAQAKSGDLTSTKQTMGNLHPPPSLIERLEVWSADLPFSNYFHGKFPGPKKIKRFLRK